MDETQREKEIKTRLYEIQEEKETLDKEYQELFWELKKLQGRHSRLTNGGKGHDS